jgi:hypothetical protein
MKNKTMLEAFHDAIQLENRRALRAERKRVWRTVGKYWPIIAFGIAFIASLIAIAYVFAPYTKL